jgi:hypothetical protein
MNPATKILEWGDGVFGYQQEHGARETSTTHNILRFHPLPDGGAEAHFGTTAYFCGGTVVHRADGSIILSAEQRADLARQLLPASAPAAYVNGDELDNMLDDRTATIQTNPSGYRRTPLYRDKRPALQKLLAEMPDPETASDAELRAWARVAAREVRA